jgi:hypothetical protein
MMASRNAVAKVPSLSMKDFDEFFGSQEEELVSTSKTDQVILQLQQQGLEHRITLDRFVDVERDDIEVEPIHSKGDLSYFANAKREGLLDSLVIFFFFFISYLYLKFVFVYKFIFFLKFIYFIFYFIILCCFYFLTKFSCWNLASFK